MKKLRQILRLFKYYLKFINKRKEVRSNYFVNSNNNNELTNIMNKYGSDKGNLNLHHNYTNLYSDLFFHKRRKIINFLEIGLGTNNIKLESNMGKDGVPLASLRGWKEYFANANIYGGDIDKDILKDEDRIKTFYVDQRDQDSIKKMFKEIGVPKFDIIIDDGLHEFNANITLFENSIGFLEDDGSYIVEDVYHKDKLKFINYLDKKNFLYSIYDIFHETNIANNIVIVIRKNI